MTAQDQAKPHLRIPEPHEVVAWLGARWDDFRRYMARPEHRVLVAMMWFGLLMRLSFLDLIPVRSEIIDILARVAALSRGDMPSLALSASDNSAPGLLVYLYWLPSLISRDPRWLAAVQVLTFLLSMLLFYHLARRRLGQSVALYALTILCVNPWALYFSRGLMAEAWYIPLAVLVLYGLDKALSDGSLIGWLVAMLSLAALTYLSLANIALVLVILVLMLLYRHRIVWLHFSVSVLSSLVVLLPGLYASNAVRFALVVAWLKEWFVALTKPEALMATLKQMMWLQSGQRLQLLTAPEELAWGNWEPLLLLGRVLGWLAMLALPCAFWAALRAWSRWRKRGQDVLLVVSSVWLILGLSMAFRPQPATEGMGALLTMVPVAGLALAVTIERLLDLPNQKRLQKFWWSQPLRLTFALLLGLMVIWQAYQTLHLNGHVGQSDVSAAYGVPYRYWRRTANLVKREARQEEIAQLWMLAPDDEGVLAQAPEMLDYLLHGQVQVVPLGDASSEGVLLPAARSGLYLSTGSSSLAGRAVAQLGAEDRGVVLFPDGATRARIQIVAERPVQDLLETIQVPGQWAYDAGVRLLGYDWPPSLAPGQTISVATYWTFADVPSADRVMDHRVFVRLIDEKGEMLAEASGMALAEADWQAGYLLKQWWRIALPETTLPEQAFLLIGMYRPEDGYRNQYVDAHGQALGDAVLLGPVSLGR